MSAKHTPGPWEAIENGKRWGIFRAKNGEGLIASVGTSHIEQEGNARLIAAAPELLEALCMVRDADEDCKRDGLSTIPAMARAKIDAAIAKATGGAP